jgi:hypothetical protein
LKKSSALSANHVFLNLPFEKSFEPIFAAYIVGLITLGWVPRSVLELDETGEGRMERLFQLLRQCPASVHDLSYLGSERRYNMPFELGVAYALARLEKGRKVFVFEAKKRDLLRTLTDLRHFDPKRHNMSGEKALEAIYDCFFSAQRADAEAVGRQIYRSVMEKMLPTIRGDRPDVFNKRSFLLLSDLVASQANLSSTAS